VGEGYKDGGRETCQEGEHSYRRPDVSLCKPLVYGHVGGFVEGAGHRRAEEQCPREEDLPAVRRYGEGSEPRRAHDRPCKEDSSRTGHVAQRSDEGGQGARDHHPEAQGAAQERRSELSCCGVRSEQDAKSVVGRAVGDVGDHREDEHHDPSVPSSVGRGFSGRGRSVPHGLAGDSCRVRRCPPQGAVPPQAGERSSRPGLSRSRERWAFSWCWASSRSALPPLHRRGTLQGRPPPRTNAAPRRVRNPHKETRS
jgi:hypothetical protein